MDPKKKAKLLEIPHALLEKLFPSSHGAVQDFLVHKIPYQRPSAYETAANAYLSEDIPTCSDIDPTTLSMPPNSVMDEIVEALRQQPLGITYASIRCAHIPGDHNTYPLWICSYWVEARTLRETRERWRSAVGALEARIQRMPSDILGGQILDRILALPWSSGLRGFCESDVEGVFNFCKPTAWFKTTEINQMLELFDDNDELHHRGIRVVPSDYSKDVVTVYQNKGLEYGTSRRYRRLRELGEDFANDEAKELATVANIGGDHETAYQRRACLRQIDGYNCGLFAANRVGYYINANKYPLLDPLACADERLHVIL